MVYELVTEAGRGRNRENPGQLLQSEALQSRAFQVWSFQEQQTRYRTHAVIYYYLLSYPFVMHAEK